MTDPVSFTSEDFLASTADLVSALARFAGSSNLHSSQRRRAQHRAAAALSTVLRNNDTTVHLTVQPPGAIAAPEPAMRRTAGKGTQSNRCQCGQCKWCQDDVRWDRIFNERFDDPAYYGLVVRQSSPLAEA